MTSHWDFIPSMKTAKFLPFIEDLIAGYRRYYCVTCGEQSGELRTAEELDAWEEQHKCPEKKHKLRLRR